jgi:hypothetical protein
MKPPAEFYAKLPERANEELYDMLAHEEDYLAEAVQAARDELRRRKLPPERPGVIEAPAETVAAEEQRRAARLAMTNDERALLENLLSSLDRLFDREARVVDLRDLVFATERALAASDFGPPLRPFVSKLDTLVRAKYTEEERREEALIATDELRHFLADTLYDKDPEGGPFGLFTHRRSERGI